jgi:hemerythrin-like domain-containing protein
MTQPSPAAAKSTTDHTPIGSFSHSHDGIVRHLDAMKQLPELLHAAERARELAEKTRWFFREVIFEHHQEEERALFEAVMASAAEGDELAQMKSAIDRLTREHRAVESMCKQLEPELKKMAKGQPCNLDLPAIEKLITEYGAHARYEEDEFLPKADAILSRNPNHMAALGLTLHMRHVDIPESAT